MQSQITKLAGRRLRRFLAGFSFAAFVLAALVSWWFWDSDLRRAEACYANGQLFKAIQHARVVWSKSPKHPRASRIIALSLVARDDPENAEVYFRMAAPCLSLEDKRIRAHALMMRGKTAEASRVCAEILDQSPQDTASLRNIAVLLFQQGNTDKAVEYATRLSEQPGQGAVGNALLGTFYRRMHRPARTVEALEKVLELDPSLELVPEPYRMLLDLIESCYESGYPEKAEEYSQRALKIKRSSELLVVLGRLRSDAGKTEQAEAYWLEALELNPKNDKALAELGSLEIWRGEVNKAQDFFTRTIECNPFSVQGHYGLGLVFNRLGKTDLAKHHTTQAKALREKEVERLLSEERNLP